MPYKSKELDRKCKADWYQNNKELTRGRLKERRRKLSIWLFEFKQTLCCIECGESHPACLEFHHRDPTDKFAEVSSMPSRCFPKERILEEIAKCNPMCSNCHRKLHFELDTHRRVGNK